MTSVKLDYDNLVSKRWSWFCRRPAPTKTSQKGLRLTFTADSCKVRDDDLDEIDAVTNMNGLYRHNRKKLETSLMITETEIWHRSLGHLNQQSMKKLAAMADGMDIWKEATFDCITCAAGSNNGFAF